PIHCCIYESTGLQKLKMRKLRQLISEFSKASEQSKRSVGSLLIELIRLHFSLGRIGASEYLDFRLHMNNLTFEEKCAFGGYRAEAILEEILIDDYARFISLDKITMYALLEGYGLPFPKIHAIYGSRRPGSFLCLDSPQALASYFENPASLPVYAKPSFGAYGRGNVLISGLRDGYFILGDRSTVELHKFCQSLEDRGGLGWILQEPLTAEARIAELCGDKISGVRIHSFMSSDGPVLTKAIWKINVGTEDSDNFRDGESGNLAGALDIQTGKVIRVVSGLGLTQLVDLPHPKTGAQLVGFSVPYWNEIKSLVYDAHLAFPGFICPGWDIAICEDGPKILEVNYFGDIDLPQRAYNRGFMDEAFLSLMRSRNLDQLLYGSSGSGQRSETNGRFGRRKHHWKW
ncbi:MAG: sugar-transfer associated ATP-grasp domain-containing protein, partial [Azonexus sp.]